MYPSHQNYVGSSVTCRCPVSFYHLFFLLCPFHFCLCRLLRGPYLGEVAEIACFPSTVLNYNSSYKYQFSPYHSTVSLTPKWFLLRRGVNFSFKKKIIIIKCQKNFSACYNGEERMEFFFPSLCLPVFLWLFCYWGKMWRTEKQKEPREPSALYYPFVWGVWGMAAQVLPLVMKSSSIKDRTCSLLLGQRGKWLFQHFSNFNK